MINKNLTTYTFGFALVVCIVCSFLLALISEGLRPRRELNEEIDFKKNILKAVELKEPLSKDMSMEQMEEIYQRKISELFINSEGAVVENNDMAEKYPLYIYREQGDVVAYAFPVYGKGLWSTIYGFLALEPDAITIRGITFYKHGETPGLGGEVSSEWFQQSFVGKKIYDVTHQKLRPVNVIKGKVEEKVSGLDKEFAVDGITGATMTSKGVSDFLDKWIRVYEPYFSKVRKQYQGIKALGN